jgi:hypothetical protein
MKLVSDASTHTRQMGYLSHIQGNWCSMHPHTPGKWDIYLIFKERYEQDFHLKLQPG